MTANAMKGDREKCIDAGMDDYLSKPINPQELLGMITKWSSEQKSEVGGQRSEIGGQRTNNLEH